MTTRSLTSARGTRVLAIAVVAAAAAFANAAPASASYAWPLKPFHRQHPVRAYFGDPRIGLDHGEVHRTIHFGIDIAAPNGTAVYASTSGRISIHPLHPDTVLVQSGGVTLEYWHVVPALRSGYATAYRTVIGHIEAPWAHVHFAERDGATYVNPLRPGALAPYRDTTRPTIRTLRVEHQGRHAELVLDAFDTTPMLVPAPWGGLPVTPALVEWRLLGPQIAAMGWKIAADFRTALPTSYDAIYAPASTQNHVGRPGSYEYVLSGDFSPQSLPAGRYVVEARVADTRGNVATTKLAFQIGTRR